MSVVEGCRRGLNVMGGLTTPSKHRYVVMFICNIALDIILKSPGGGSHIDISFLDFCLFLVGWPNLWIFTIFQGSKATIPILQVHKHIWDDKLFVVHQHQLSPSAALLSALLWIANGVSICNLPFFYSSPVQTPKK